MTHTERTLPARKADKGHSLVRSETWTDSRGWPVRYRMTCQCGQQFGSKRTKDRCFYAHSAHLKAVA
jgi:hypothetical protein